MTVSWQDWACELAVDLQALRPRQFLVLDCLVGLEVNPYVQVARESEATWYCEVASMANFSAQDWLADDLVLVAAGWEPPEAPLANWSLRRGDCDAIVDWLVEAIRFARGCKDPNDIVGTRGRWPSPPTDADDQPDLHPSPFGLAA